MKGIVKGLSALALATAVFAAPVQAQGSMVGVSGAGIFSLEDEGGSDFGAGASFEWSGANGFGVRLDGNYIFDPELFIIDANVMYTFMTSDASMVHPYILAGGTLFGIDSFDENQFGVSAGAGANFMLQNSPITPFVDARFIRTFDKDTDLGTIAGASSILVNAGVKFAIGGN
jgi:hypothetical protein